MDFDFVRLGIGLGVLLFSASFHEAAHALIADKLGDSTGRSLGRISLNPLRHLDLFMSFIIPVMMLIMSGGKFALGGAKPVPINPHNFRNPSKDFAISAAAGPISNFILALATVGVLYIFYLAAPDLIPAGSYNAYLFQMLMLFNIVLGVFNLIPIPPLDGSRVFRLILPYELQSKYDMLEAYGFFIIIIALFLFNLDRVIVYPVISGMLSLLMNLSHLVFGSGFIMFLNGVLSSG